MEDRNERETMKATSIQEVWSERELAEKLGLKVGKGGRSISLGWWVRGGLKYCEIANRRFFFESDVLAYLWKRRRSSLNETRESVNEV